MSPEKRPERKDRRVGSRNDVTWDAL